MLTKCYALIFVWFSISSFVSAKECKETKEGLDYDGTTSVTKDGIQCQRWDSDFPHFPSIGIIEARTKEDSVLDENYCRAVDGHPNPWCYTTDASIRWQECDIPFCASFLVNISHAEVNNSEDCVANRKDMDYMGSKSHTSKGIECHRWDGISKMTGHHASVHENYCRNFNNEIVPWCFTKNTLEFQYCDIPLCGKPKECVETGTGAEYEGTVNITAEGIPCQAWDKNFPHYPNEVTSNRRAFGDPRLQNNYCRNLDGDIAPWCYTQNPKIRWQYCNISYCVSASFMCNVVSKNCSLYQSNNTNIKWIYKEVNNSASRIDQNTENILALDFPSSNKSTSISSLILPVLRSVAIGSCLQLQYRTQNIQLQIKSSSKNMTLLTESNDWNFVSINIRRETDNYQIFISPVSLLAFPAVAEIKYIGVQDVHCKGCFPCFKDGLCIAKSKFCDMNQDCPDFSDEQNCALECYFGSYYGGFRKETASFDSCGEQNCRLHKDHKNDIGCDIGGNWMSCNIPECEQSYLPCDFEEDMCDWKQWNMGMKWRRQVDSKTEMIRVTVCKVEYSSNPQIVNARKSYAFPERTSDISGHPEDIAILYSYPQPASKEYSCLTLLYSGHNSDLEVFLTNGTILTTDRRVFHHHNIQSTEHLVTSFQTDVDVPFMVVIKAKFTSENRRTIRIHTIVQETGLCADKGPCYPTHFQCDDGSCIKSTYVCDNTNHCPKSEDEVLCKHKSSISGVITQNNIICPGHCKCKYLTFKCTSPKNVTDEVRALDLSSNIFKFQDLKNFRFLIHLNLSSSLGTNTILKDLLAYIESSHLQNLDISHNQIDHITEKTFKNTPNLLYLNMSNNKLDVLEFGFLSNVPKLRSLIMKNNKIETISIQDKNEKREINTNLAHLDLSGNSLRSISPRSLDILEGLNELVLKDNYISNTDYYFSANMKMLTNLDLSQNSIYTISSKMFDGLNELIQLNLAKNKIEKLDRFAFYSLPALRTLNLAFNNIHTIHEFAMENLLSLTELNLTGNNLLHLHSSSFIALKNLLILDISWNGMQVLENHAFQRLSEVHTLYIQGNDLIVSKPMFEGLCNLQRMWADSYIICCARPLSVDFENCISPRDRISTCEQLISVGFLAQMIWYMAMCSLGGNIFVIYYRMKMSIKRCMTSQTIFVLNLSLSDLLMGLYLFVIAIADLEYRNVYGFSDSKWRSSVTCTVAGLLATISSEASVLFIFLITAERFMILKYPFSVGLLKNKKSVHCIAIVVWIIAILLAVIPVLIYSDFYSRSTVCISLPLTAKKSPGWEYSTSVFILFNFIIFIAVVLGQILIYAEVKRIGSTVQNDTTKREIAVFKSLSYVVLSDTLCWLPIISIGLLALAGVDISSDVYAWIIVIVLPVNSALNPFIYTLSMVYKRKMQRQHSQNSQVMTLSEKSR